MAQINEYFKNKYEKNKPKEKESEKAVQSTDMEQFRKKIARHRMTIFYRTLMIIAIIAAATVALYYNYQNMVYTDYTIVDEIKYQEATTARYLDFNGNVLRYSQDGASAFNMHNDMLWNQTFEMQNPMVDVNGDYVAIGDYKGTKVFIMNSEGIQGEVNTTLPIQKFCVSGTGIVAALLEEGDVTWVTLFDKTGDTVANIRTTMAKSGYPINVSMSEDSVLLAVSYLYIDSGVISSSVAYYNFGEVGQNEIDNLVCGYNYSGTIIPEVEFMNKSKSFIVGDGVFGIFTGSQKPEKTFEMKLEDEVKSVFHNDEYIGLVYDLGDGANRLDVYNGDGELCVSQEFSLDYSNILFVKDLIVIYNSNDCVIYNMQGTQKFKGLFRNSALTLIPTKSKTKYLLVSGSRMEEIQLK